MATLYIVGTPIGNLKDITLRAIETLKEVDLILCEDTRVTKTLLDRYEIKTPTLSYHQHSQLKKVEEIIQFLKSGKNLALVSDAGTPGIADPGGKLVESVLETLGNAVKIVSVPGTNALIAAASISGFSVDRFVFLGFPPTKNKRKKFFEEAISSKYPVVFFESKYRIIKTLQELSSITERKIVVCRELTKKFETVYRGSAKDILAELAQDEIRGEFVFVIGDR